MPYYVVNVGRGRSTHIMKSDSSSTPSGLMAFPKYALCGLQATRYVNVFSPSEASCRECKKRWQLDVAAEAAKTPAQRSSEQAAQGVMALMGLVIIIVLIIVVAVH